IHDGSGQPGSPGGAMRSSSRPRQDNEGVYSEPSAHRHSRLQGNALICGAYNCWGKEKTMKLIVPYLGELHPADARLVRLAEFLGIECVTVPAAVGSGTWASEAGVGSNNGCLVIN